MINEKHIEKYLIASLEPLESIKMGYIYCLYPH